MWNLSHKLRQSNEDIGEAPPNPIILANEGFLVILAGADTTSIVLSNAFYLLLDHPDVYKRLQEEVDRYYPAGENALDPVHYPKMSYLDAVMWVSLYRQYLGSKH